MARLLQLEECAFITLLSGQLPDFRNLEEFEFLRSVQFNLNVPAH